MEVNNRIYMSANSLVAEFSARDVTVDYLMTRYVDLSVDATRYLELLAERPDQVDYELVSEVLKDMNSLEAVIKQVCTPKQWNIFVEDYKLKVEIK